MKSSTHSTLGSQPESLESSLNIGLKRGKSVASSNEALEDKIMEWFKERGIRIANPEDIKDSHTHNQR